MEKSNKGEPEETVDLEDLAAQEENSESLQSDQQLQKSEDKLMQHEPAQKVKSLYSLQKSEESESALKRCKEFAADEGLEQETDGSNVVQQKYESPFALEQDSTPTNRSDTDALHKECSVFLADKLSESFGNTTAQRTDEAPESIPPNLDQEVTRQEDNATNQDCDRSESFKPNLEMYLTEKRKEKAQEQSSIALMEDPTAEQETNDELQQECDRTSENARHFKEGESDQESKKSHHVCFLTQQLKKEASPPLPSSICYHRTHTQRQRFPPVIEVPDEPLEPFEVEIPSSRSKRTLDSRPPTVPTGFRDYLQRVSEHHIPPERRNRYEELQKRIFKLFCGIVFGAFLYVAMVVIVNFLESKYSNHFDSNVTSPDDFSDDLSTTVTDFKTDTSVICLEADVTTPMVYSINFRADFDTEVSSVSNGMSSNSTNPVNDLK